MRARDIKYEWVLTTPVIKEFVDVETVTEYQIEDVIEADGCSYDRRVQRDVVVEKKTTIQADRIRLVSMINDKEGQRLFVRFFYGRVSNGKWRAAHLNDGVVICGPNYQNIDLDLDGVLEDNEVLLMCAKLLKWDGDLGIVGAKIRVEVEPA